MMKQKKTYKVGAMWIHLATIIAGSNVDLCLVDKTNDLNVIRGFQELNTSYGTSGDDASSMTRLAAPRYHFALGFAYSLIRY